MLGKTLLHYHFLEKLGEGGMGLVYKARDQTLGRLVAIKVLPDARLEPSSRSRFFLEARTASALNHPNIITIHEIASAEGTEMIVMEYVEGSTLSDRLRLGALPLDDVFTYAIQIADALAKAHSAGIIHRDIKPGNVMITRDGLVKVLDFGLAKVQPHSAHHGDVAPTLELTGARVVLGTAAYMSPEQAAGDPLDPRSDIFSFGVVLYEMIGGRRPFDGRTTVEVLRQLLAADEVPVEPLRYCAPPELVQVVSRALAKDREQRYPTIDLMRSELRAAKTADTKRAVALPRSASYEAPTIAIAAPDAPTISMSAAIEAATPPAATPQTAAPQTPPPLTAVPQTAASETPAPRRRNMPRTIALIAAAVTLIAVLVSLPSLRRRVGAGDTAAVEPAGSAYQHYAAGQTLMKRHDHRDNVNKAITEFTRALQIDPAFAPGYAGLADAYYRKDVQTPDPQWKRLALENATKAVDLNADLVVAQTALGRAMLANGRLDEAEQHLKKAVDIQPGQPAPLISLAGVALARQDFATAEARYREAIASAPKDWQPLAELGQLFYKRARYQEAANIWTDCAALVDDNATIYRNLGAAFHALDRPDDAAGAFQKSLEIEPSASVFNNLGTLRFFQGKYADSVMAFKKAVDMRPTLYLYWGNLGDAHRWNTATKQEAPEAYRIAIQHAEEALRAKRDDADLLSTIALYRVKSGDTAGALRDIAAVDKAPKATPAMLFRATVVYELAGKREQALAALQRTLEAGYSPREIRNEPELVSLRTDKRFHLLMSRTPQ